MDTILALHFAIEVTLFVVAFIFIFLFRSAAKKAQSNKLKFDLLQELTDNTPSIGKLIPLVEKIPFPFPEIKYFEGKIILYYQRNKTIADIGLCFSDISNSGLNPEKKGILISCLEKAVIPPANSDLVPHHPLIVSMAQAIRNNTEDSPDLRDSEISSAGINFIVQIISNHNDRDFVKFFCRTLDGEVEIMLKDQIIDGGQKKLIEAELVKIHRILD